MAAKRLAVYLGQCLPSNVEGLAKVTVRTLKRDEILNVVSIVDVRLCCIDAVHVEYMCATLVLGRHHISGRVLARCERDGDWALSTYAVIYVH